MSIDLTGITNKNEYYTNHYFATVFEENTSETISGWNAAAKESEEIRTPWSMLRQNARQYYTAHDKFIRSSVSMQTLVNIKMLADNYLCSLGYPSANTESVKVDDTLEVPVYLEMTKNNGAPLLWVILAASRETDAGIMESFAFDAKHVEEDVTGTLYKGVLHEMPNEDLVTKVLFGATEPPRFVMLIGMNQIALIDRNKWNEKRYLQFELEEIFSRLENTTLQAMAVLLHCESLCPSDGKILLDELDEQSQKNASGVSQDLKYALRESIEILGNEVLYDMRYRQGRDLEADPVDAGQLTLECLRYMYRMLFVLFIEARPELGYAPIKAQSYYSGYSLESLRDIADNIRDDVDEVGEGYYLHETLAKLYELIYDGYPKTEEELKKATGNESKHDMFLIAPLKAHIFDPEYTRMIKNAKLRNSCMLRIIDLMSLTRSTGRRNSRRGRISYANLGINQMGAVYEALLSYRGFIAEHDLYEVKRAGDTFNELDVGYFVAESELEQYTEDERVRYETGEKKGKLRMYEKGTFIYRLAGREREKSASFYTPEVLTKCLVKYALKELLEGKTADEILKLTICEPAMGSAAFLNEAINQMAEAYVSRKEQETGEIISYEKRFNELQKVKMFIADRNVYGIDLNPIAVELAEVSLWLNTIYEGGFVPWFGTQLVNGNSLIGARRQVYRIENAQATSKGLRWYEMEPERLPFNEERADKGYKFGRKQIYHFLLGDPGMCAYSDKVIKSLEPDNIKKMVKWNKDFTAPITDDDVITLLRLSKTIDELWEAQIKLRKEVGEKTQDNLSIYGHADDAVDSHTTIRQKDKIFSELYKSEHMKNAGPYARLKFAMDYWCSLWFWPIDKADLLPSRSEFLFDMSLILEGTTEAVVVTDTSTDKKQMRGQMSLFPTEMQQLELNITALYEGMGVVDIPALRKQNPRLDLAARIAEQNKFMHWELEFADLFAEHGGFDLIIGNPPWIKLTWNEHSVLSDQEPKFAVKKMTATQTTYHRAEALESAETRYIFFQEYEMLAGMQSFLNAIQNYADLRGQQTNLYKCFFPLAWTNLSKRGVFSYVSPDSIFDDPNGGKLRSKLYHSMKYHFQFENELKLFAEIHSRITYSISVIVKEGAKSFDSISNLYSPATIDECYESDGSDAVPGIKNENDEWNVRGHSDRILHITKNELSVFAKLFDSDVNWDEARLPSVHAASLLKTLKCFSDAEKTIASLGKEHFFSTVMWDETNAVEAGIMSQEEHFPTFPFEMVYSGPLISVGNPCFKSARASCQFNSDYDNIDLLELPENYLPRCKYIPGHNDGKNSTDYQPITGWGAKANETYRIIARKMINASNERTLICAIAPVGVNHTNGVISFMFDDNSKIPLIAGLFSSIPYDFFIKTLKKTNLYEETAAQLPVIETKITQEVCARAMLLNCLTKYYDSLVRECWHPSYADMVWSKKDKRLDNDCFKFDVNAAVLNIGLKNDYGRRQALVEIDVLTAMALGMSLNQLKTIYHIQFPVLQSYEADTWYDSTGRIVFTNNRSLSNVGFDRKTWENEIKGALPGKKFYRSIIDDTMPGGPVARTIEYVAPFDRCDREKDYETAWEFFEKKYKHDK